MNNHTCVRECLDSINCVKYHKSEVRERIERYELK